MTQSAYAAACSQAANHPDAFWAEVAQTVDWIKAPTVAGDVSFDRADFHIHWYADGQLNVSANCLDRHLATRANQAAIIWEGDDPNDSRTITYADLHAEVCRLANVLTAKGVQPGDRITIYMPMIPEAAIAMLACARIGAVHSVVFGGFSPESLANRILDCGSQVVITADGGMRGGKAVPLKPNVDQALVQCPHVHTVLMFTRLGADVAMTPGRDHVAEILMKAASPVCPATVMDAEAPLFILYTSGSTGKPKGVLHSTGGYLVWAAYTHNLVFDDAAGEVFWCTADVGWVTGHTYTVYGALANGATTVMFEGVPNHPDPGRFWSIIDKHKVRVFYTAPTAIRALMREGEDWVHNHDLSTLRLLGSVGEPINPEAWLWYHRHVGKGQLPIVDTWWQTETGGCLMSPLPGVSTLKPGCAMIPMPGVNPVLVDATGQRLESATEGNLCLASSWPGQARTIWGDHQRFIDTYFSTYPGLYFTGDGARRDSDGDIWITGRVDDVLNVSGHRLGTAEVESALVEHPSVAEAAVVGFPHEIKGEGIYCYVTLKAGIAGSDILKAELVKAVRTDIGPTATPDFIQFAPSLPKTRSGKIMRRILRKIAADDFSNLGDTSTLADPGVVEDLIANRQNRIQSDA
jgi:acetyl-CoA synthetase